MAARHIMTWERVWPRLVPVLSVMAGWVGLTLIGVFEMVPPGAHAVLLGLFAIAFGITLILPWYGFKRPTRRQVIDRLEQENGLQHAPLQGLDDTITDIDDPLTSFLWHRQTRFNEITTRNLRLPYPRPLVARYDRRGLTVIPVLLLFIGLLGGGNHAAERLEQALNPLHRLGSANFQATLWITPPAYTGKIPSVLKSDQTANAKIQSSDSGKTDDTVLNVQAPAGSRLSGSIISAWEPELDTPAGARKISKTADNNFAIDTPLDQSGSWQISVWGTTRLTLNVDVIADKAPKIGFSAPPTRTRRDHLRIDYTASDDYGLKSLNLVITPRPDGTDPGVFGGQKNIVVDMMQDGGTEQPTGNAPVSASENTGTNTPSDLATQPGATSNAPVPTHLKGPFFINLVSHPWAGLPVNLQLVATDNAGQKSTSETQSIVLPEREFTHPVARKLITIRRGLMRYPDRAAEMRDNLLPVLGAPQAYNGDIGVFLGLSVATARLSAGLDNLAVHRDVAGLLWQIAEDIERGSYGMAERNLIDAENRLLDALSAPNVTEKKLSELLAQYRQALNEYLAALARDGQKAAQERAQPSGTTIEQQDLSRVVDQIDALMRAGARDKARDLLDRLRELVENMRVTPGGPGQNIAGPLREMLDGMRDLSRRQRQLMNNGNGRSEDNTPLPGSDARAQSQQQLTNDAQALTKDEAFNRFGQISGLDDAIKSMQQASEALGHNREHEALQKQQEALARLQQGIGQLGRVLEGLSQLLPMLDDLNPDGRRDPLGRPVGGNGETTIPDANTLERAWRILQELRRRSGDPDRPQIEHDYINRLLKRF